MNKPVQLQFTVEEMAEQLRLSMPVAYQLCRRPDFPAIRYGRTIRIPVDGLRRWLDEHAGEVIA